MKITQAVSILAFVVLQANAGTGSKILATGAVTQIEGSSGSGLVPWATIAGYAEKGESDFTAAFTYLDTGDYRFKMKGLSWGWSNRLELSLAKQSLELNTLGPAIGLPNAELKQDVFALKVRLFGHLIYSPFGQVSLGLQYKNNTDFFVPSLVGAKKNNGTDINLTVTKLFLSQPFGLNGFATVNLRSTNANETGLLGFSGDLNQSRRLLFESSLGVFIKKDIAIGFDFRQKKSNLAFSKESHWRDVFIAWFPTKSTSLVLAYVDLGTIATLNKQQGVYFSISGVF